MVGTGSQVEHSWVGHFGISENNFYFGQTCKGNTLHEAVRPDQFVLVSASDGQSESI